MSVGQLENELKCEWMCMCSNAAMLIIILYIRSTCN